MVKNFYTQKTFVAWYIVSITESLWYVSAFWSGFGGYIQSHDSFIKLVQSDFFGDYAPNLTCIGTTVMGGGYHIGYVFVGIVDSLL